MSFLSVMPSGDASNGYLDLKIGKDSLEVVPDLNVNITDLNRNDKNTLYKHFFNNGFGGITFKAEITIKSDELWNNKKVTDVLNDWFTNSTILNVATNAIDIPNGTYIITKNDSRKQNFLTSTVWNLEFTTYTALNVHKFANDNTNVLNALKKAKKLTTVKSKKKTKSKSTINQKLKKCNRKTLVYSKKKKAVTCVKYMQQVLYKNKFLTKKQIDGWYGPVTVKAVKKFQQKYNKTHVKTINITANTVVTNNKKNLSYRIPVTGKVDADTFKELCKS